ncbi:MAG: PKD domain-containing protein [Thermoproteota archaeon]|nr:PKD domain-containing protein [Thermoproteota archaeon]
MPKAFPMLLTLVMMTMVAGTLFAAPSSSLAQQQQQQQQTNTGTAAVTTPPPLTPGELQQQERLESIINATTRNLVEGQKQIDGLVYTPRWSNATWVEPDSLAIAFAYCLPGEFAESGQHIIGGSDLEVLESYVLAITNNLTGWLIVVENENENARLLAAAGAICSSDANVTEARILSPQEQIVINNIINQFTTVRNDITQVINIINNVTRPPPNNNTDPLTVTANIADIDQAESPVVSFEILTDGGRPPFTCEWDLGDGTTADTCSVSHIYENTGTYTASVTVTDSVGQTGSDSTPPFNITNTGGNNTGGIPAYWRPPVITVPDDITVQAIGPAGAPVAFEVSATENLEGDTYTVPVSCDPASGGTFPIGVTVVTCTAMGTVFDNGQRHITQESFAITVEQPPSGGETVEPPTDDTEAEATPPPTNNTGGQ